MTPTVLTATLLPQYLSQIKGKATEVSDRVSAVGHDIKAKVQGMFCLTSS
jgi:hypothetical protein